MAETEGRIWIEVDGRRIVTDEIAALLDAIDDVGTLLGAAERLDVAYSHAWSLIRDLEDALDDDVVAGTRGGADHGGSRLTPAGRELLDAYRDRARALASATQDRFWRALGYQISARNRFDAEVVEVVRDDAAAHVTLETQGPVEIASLITRDAADELDLAEGDRVEAVVKATEVMVGKPAATDDDPTTGA